MHVGDLAGSIGKTGYRVIGINSALYKAHRLAWLYVYGTWPKRELDHRNRKPDDNKIKNLRPANRYLQTANCARRTPTRCNLLSGVRRNPESKQNPFVAQIQRNHQKIHLGVFPTELAAHKAYMKAWGGLL